jgi:hypothetical protein
MVFYCVSATSTSRTVTSFCMAASRIPSSHFNTWQDSYLSQKPPEWFDLFLITLIHLFYNYLIQKPSIPFKKEFSTPLHVSLTRYLPSLHNWRRSLETPRRKRDKGIEGNSSHVYTWNTIYHRRIIALTWSTIWAHILYSIRTILSHHHGNPNADRRRIHFGRNHATISIISN